MLERDHTLLDHVAELVLLVWFAFFGFVVGRLLVQALQPKPVALGLSPEELERNRAEAEKRWRDEQAEQRRLLAEEIAYQLCPERHQRTSPFTDDGAPMPSVLG
jgi:hypothetical protein